METLDVAYNPKFEELFYNKKFFKILYGSAGSGKSYAIAQHIIKRVLKEKGHHAWAFRKVSTYVTDSVYGTLKEVISSFGVEEYFSFNKTLRIISCINGNQISCVGLDEPEKIKSITKMTIAWIEEATEFNEKDIDQVSLRMRGVTDLYREMILSFNPISELHWIKQKFFDNPVPGLKSQLWTLHSDFRDNLYLDDAYIDRLINMHSHDPNNYLVYVLGQWGKVITGSEYYKNFKETDHVKENVFDPVLPIHVSFDFNVIPYMACTFFQVQELTKAVDVRGLSEIRLVSPKNSTEDMCYEILERWPHTAGIVLYGDATGRARKTSSKRTDYMIIEQILGSQIIEMRVPRSNPLPQDRHTFMNRMLFGTFPINFSVHPEMKYTIQDLTHVLEDGERRKIKETGKDPVSKRTYEKYGHFSDSVDYLMCELFKHYM